MAAAVTTIATSATFTIPGAPPNWSNERGHHMAIHRAKDVWKERSWLLAHGARSAAGWPLLERAEPSPRWVHFRVHRHRLLDEDNLVASIKPCLDGMKGVLIWDDSPRWCHLIGVEQVRVETGAEEHVSVCVYLVDPR